MDPRTLFDTEPVTLAQMETGDFVRCSGWSRPRQIVHSDENADGRVVFMADPDERFETKPRRLDRAEYEDRGGDGNWLRYPNLRQLWETAQGA